MPDAAAPEITLIHGARQLLTLNGPAGPRRGAAMQDIGAIADGAVLIRGGVIEDVGPTRRVANLVRARKAREIDATGRVVMPAFVDPDAPLIVRPISSSRGRMEIRAKAMAQALASYGVLATGASTEAADDPKNALRSLRVQNELQAGPVRIRSVLAWRDGYGTDSGWLDGIRSGRLAAIIEFEARPEHLESLRDAARLVLRHGFAVRFRSRGAIDRNLLELAAAADAIALHGSSATLDSLAAGELNGVFVAECAGLVDNAGANPREAPPFTDTGLAVAISSAFRPGIPASFNMQFNLHLACSRLKLTPEQAITAATHNAACALLMGDSAGSLAPGRSADLLIMDVPDYRELVLRAGHHDVLMAMRAGRVIYRRPTFNLE